MSDVDTIRAAINTQFATDAAISLADAAGMASDHILVFVHRRFTPGRMLSGIERIRGGRVVTRYVATDEDNVHTMRDRVATALENQTLAGDVGPFVFESADTLQMDDGWFTAADSWVY